MITQPLRRHAIAVASGILMPLAFAPFNMWWLMPAAMAGPMLLWQKDKPWQGFMHGWLFGFAMFSFGLWWIHISISIYGNLHTMLAIAITMMLAALLALYPAITGYLACCGRKMSAPQRQLMWIPALWLLAEWLRARCFSGFSWLSPGYSQIDSPLAGLLPLGGTLTVLAVLAVSSGLLVLAILGYKHKIRIAICIAIIWLAALCLTPLQWFEQEDELYTATLVQAAIPQELKWDPEYLESTKKRYWQLSEPYWSDTDLMLWPEAVIPAFKHQITDYINALDVKRRQSDLLLGIPVYDRDTDKFYNGMLALSDNSDRQEQVYYKKHLVPFGEYLPFATILQPVFDRFNIPYSQFSHGDGDNWLPSPMGAAGIMICYEVIFADSTRAKLPQAKILINVSNDAWFGDSAGPHQHLQIARTRARETGRFMLRATNNGISAVIDPFARVLTQSQQFQDAVITAQVAATTGATPYVVLGDIPVLLLALVVIVMLLWLIRRYG